jgi:hypothetical protein
VRVIRRIVLWGLFMPCGLLAVLGKPSGECFQAPALALKLQKVSMVHQPFCVDPRFHAWSSLLWRICLNRPVETEID